MLKFLPSFVLGVISLLLVSLNTILCASIILFLTLLKLLVSHAGFRAQISKVLIFIAEIWIEGNSLMFRWAHKLEWDVQGLEDLPAKGSYLVVCNHQTWTDIFVLQHIFKRRIPFLKFFLKKELIWVPFLGAAWWALDFPFLKRYSRQFLAKHPELRGKDMETTRKQCEKFKDYPVSVMNFLEGTRFTKQKHQQQKSPYRHLLSPKAGGVALVLSSMGDYLSSVLDVTIVYPENKPRVTIWDLLSGKIPRILVRANILPIPENVVGKNYVEDDVYREHIQQWVNRLWREKDLLIEELKITHSVPSASEAVVSRSA